MNTVAMDSDAYLLADLVKAWAEKPPSGLQGIVWYRPSSPGDRLNWGWPVLKNIITGVTLVRRWTVDVIAEPEGYHRLVLRQAGSAPDDLPALIRLRVPGVKSLPVMDSWDLSPSRHPVKPSMPGRAGRGVGSHEIERGSFKNLRDGPGSWDGAGGKEAAVAPKPKLSNAKQKPKCKLQSNHSARIHPLMFLAVLFRSAADFRARMADRFSGRTRRSAPLHYPFTRVSLSHAISKHGGYLRHLGETGGAGLHARP